MAQLFVVFCCFLACPMIVGGMMWFIGRDGQAGRVEREIRRLNRVAARGGGRTGSPWWIS